MRFWSLSKPLSGRHAGPAQQGQQSSLTHKAVATLLTGTLALLLVSVDVQAQSLGDWGRRLRDAAEKVIAGRIPGEPTASTATPVPQATPSGEAPAATSPPPVAGLPAGLPHAAGEPALASAPGVQREDASCVTAELAGEESISGANKCGVAVRFDFCAIGTAQSTPARFTGLLQPDQAWSVAFATMPGAAPLMNSNYCRASDPEGSCNATCPSAAGLAAPSWTRRPNVADFYPQAAMRRELSGRVVLSCTINGSGRPDACSVVEETPAGMGFGEAAMRMARTMRAAPLGADGQPVAGKRFEIPVNFTLS